MKSQRDDWVVLNPEEEQELTFYRSAKAHPDRLIDSEAIAYIREVNAIPRLSVKQEFKLAERIAKGDQEAFTQLVRAMLHFVVGIARNYINSPLPLLDRIQAGNIGLMTAINGFDYQRGAPLKLYAKKYILSEITNAIHKETRSIYVPVDAMRRIKRIHQRIEEMAQALGTMPSAYQIADVFDMLSQELQALLASYEQILSLDAPISEDGFDTLVDTLEGTVYPEPASALEAGELHALLNAALAQLTVREQKVLGLRLGLTYGEELTLEEVGQLIHVTRERVRQIEAKALKTLRYPRINKPFVNYI